MKSENPTTPTLEALQAERDRLRAEFEAQGGRGVVLADAIDRLDRLIALREDPRSYHRVEIKVVVVTDRPWDPQSLRDVAYHLTDGDFAGEWDVVENREITTKEAADLLIEMGSEPEFYSLDEDGRRLDEEQEEEGDA